MVKDSISLSLQGINATIFVYGQTASGKTFTMRGNKTKLGLIPLSIAEIFNEIKKDVKTNYKVKISFMELYNENIKDLLVEKSEKLDLGNYKGEVFIKNLTTFEVNSSEDAIKLFHKGDSRKEVSGTQFNDCSSRSHTIFRILLESTSETTPTIAARFAQLNLVDLAGSESVSKIDEIRSREGKSINKSLLALSNVIHHLSSGDKKHINFRDSKLTRILKSALSGNSRTGVICTINLNKINYQETLNTLLFGVKIQKIHNDPHVNIIMDDDKTRYQLALKEIQRQNEEIKFLADNNKKLKELIANRKSELDHNKLQDSSNDCNENAFIKFQETISKLKGLNEVDKEENTLIRKQFVEKNAELLFVKNQILELKKIRQERNKKIIQLKNNSIIEYQALADESIKDIALENSETQNDNKSEDDEISVLSLKNIKSRSIMYIKPQSNELYTSKKSIETPKFYDESRIINEPFDEEEEFKSKILECECIAEKNKNLIHSYMMENKRLTDKLDHAKFEQYNNGITITRLIKEKEDFTVKYEMCKVKSEKLSEELSKNLIINKKLNNTNEKLNSKLEKFNNIKAILAKTQNELINKIPLIGTLEAQVQTLGEELSSALQEKNKLELEIHNLKMHKCPTIECMKDDIDDKENIIKHLKIEKRDWEIIKDKLTKEIDCLKNKLQDCENQLDQTNGYNMELKSKIKELEEINLEHNTNYLNCKSQPEKRKIYRIIKINEERKAKRRKKNYTFDEFARLTFIKNVGNSNISQSNE